MRTLKQLNGAIARSKNNIANLNKLYRHLSVLERSSHVSRALIDTRNKIKDEENILENLLLDANEYHYANVTKLDTELNSCSDQYKIELAINNLVATFGREALIEANKRLKLTRRANTRVEAKKAS